MIAVLSANTKWDGGPLCVFKGLLPQNGSHTWLEVRELLVLLGELVNEVNVNSFLLPFVENSPHSSA